MILAALSGRYAIFHGGIECGEERWELRPDDAGGVVATGAQETLAPHPYPSRQEWRATLDRGGRLSGLEILWTVGAPALRAIHEAREGRWRVRIERGGEVREQQGDYPEGCEVEFGTHLANLFILARRDFAVDGEHEFPVLRIGPPWMAVSPERMRIRCVERGRFAGPEGPVAAKRYVVSLPPRPEAEGYTFWADEDGFVLESYDGPDTGRSWMRLVEVRRAV
jgi:hypothetical protein